MSRRAATLLVRLAAIWIAALAGLGGARAEEAAMRIVAHPRFVRIVVVAPTAPAARLEADGRVARLRFLQPLALTVPPVPAAAGLWLVAAELREGGRQLALALAPGVSARRAESGPDRLAIDLLPASSGPDPAAVEPAAAPAAPVQTTDRGLRIRTGRHPTHLRVVLEGPRVRELGVRTAPARLELTGPADLLPAIARRFEALAPAVGGVAVDGGTLGVELAPGTQALPRAGRPDQIVLDLQPNPRSGGDAPGPPSPGSSKTPSAVDRPRVPGPPPEATALGPRSPWPPGCGDGGDRLCVLPLASADGASVRLMVSPRPAIAVLVRAGAAWVVLDRVVDAVEVAEAPPPPAAAPLLRAVTREAHPEATVLRLELAEPAAIRALPKADGWWLELRRGPAPAPADEAVPRRQADPPALAVEARGRVVRLPAKLLGSEVSVLTTHAGSPRSAARELVDLEFLPAAHGLAWRPVADDLWAREVDGATVIGRPGGLRLDAAPPTPPTADAANGPAAASAAAPLPAPVDGPLQGHETATAAPATPSPPAAPVPSGEPRPPAEAPSGTTAPSPAAVRTPVPAPPAPPGGLSEPSSRTSEPPIGLARDPAAGRAGQGTQATGPRAGPAPAGAERDAAPDRARRELARAELARGRAAEALALLGDPPAALDAAAEPPSDAATRALVGVAAALLERPRVAARLLDDPRLAADPEVALWRGLVAGQERDWRAAGQALAASGRAFQGYPPALQRRLAPLLARILVEIGRTAAAFAVVDLARRSGPEPREAARLQLVESLGLQRDGALEEAAAAFRATAEGADRTAAIEARYRLARLEQERGRVGPAETLAELGRQRLHWRDHPAAPEMLDGLAETLAAAGRTAEALEAGRDLVARHPETPRAAAAVERGRTLLAAALAGTDAGATDPVTALRLLRRFPELLAEGEAGTAPMLALARRLAAAALPSAAAGLLAEQVVPRLRGSERALTTLELAELRLAAGEPAAALDLLRAEAGPLAALPETTARVRALRAAAEARGADGRPADPGTAAAQQFEEAWRSRDWPAAAAAGRRLLAAGTPPEPGRERPGLRLRVAVALAAGGDAEAARALLGAAGEPGEPEAARRVVALLAEPAPLRGDALEVARAIDGELALLRAGLAVSR